MAENSIDESIPTWSEVDAFLEENEFPCPMCGNQKWEIPQYGDKWLCKVPLTDNDGRGIYPMGLSVVLTVCVYCAFVAPRAVYRVKLQPGILAGEATE